MAEIPDYAKPSAGLIIRGVITSNQSVYAIPGNYAGLYKVNTGNPTVPSRLSGVIFLAPVLTTGADRQGYFIRSDGRFFILNGKDTKWLGCVPESRTINGHILDFDIIINSQDIFGTAEYLGASDLNAYKNAGLYFQNSNSTDNVAFRHYPSSLSGSLRIEKDAGITQTYTAYNGGGQWRRGYYNSTWTAWVTVFDSGNLDPVLSVNNAKPDAKGNVSITVKNTDVRLGARLYVARDDNGNNLPPSGYVVVGVHSNYNDKNWELDHLYCDPLQKSFDNGVTWVTVTAG